MGDERQAAVQRTTAETAIQLQLKLDGEGRYQGTTGLPFFDHMLTLMARHGLMDLTLVVAGDLQVDGHHTVEDLGICLGQAINRALGERQGITRYGSALVPMDEALVLAVVDISGRPYLAYQLDIPTAQVGNFDTQLVEEFCRALVNHAGMTLHLRGLAGSNSHHIVEAAFKALGRALAAAASLDPRVRGIPSTKGQLDWGQSQ